MRPSIPRTSRAARCVYWSPPRDPKKVEEAMAAAAIELPPGKMLVFLRAATTAGHARMIEEARAVARSLDMTLVQWPDSPPEGESRDWCYALQKKGSIRE